MNDSLIETWKLEEQQPFGGWDFSHLANRVIDEKPPWSYEDLARSLLRRSTAALDLGTGGGERLARLAEAFPERVAATEGYAPNLEVATKRLAPLGVEVAAADEGGTLPFSGGSFDLVLDRHSAFDVAELARVLRPGGVFLTQQVAGDNLVDLAAEFGVRPDLTHLDLSSAVGELRSAEFEVERQDEWSGAMTFKDVGALVYYLKAVPWQVPDFSVDRYRSVLANLHDRLVRGLLRFRQGRFLIQARKTP